MGRLPVRNSPSTTRRSLQRTPCAGQSNHRSLDPPGLRRCRGGGTRDTSRYQGRLLAPRRQGSSGAAQASATRRRPEQFPDPSRQQDRGHPADSRSTSRGTLRRALRCQPRNLLQDQPPCPRYPHRLRQEALNAQRPRDYDPQPIRGVLPVRSSSDTQQPKHRSPLTSVWPRRIGHQPLPSSQFGPKPQPMLCLVAFQPVRSRVRVRPCLRCWVSYS